MVQFQQSLCQARALLYTTNTPFALQSHYKHQIHSNVSLVTTLLLVYFAQCQYELQVWYMCEKSPRFDNLIKKWENISKKYYLWRIRCLILSRLYIREV